MPLTTVTVVGPKKLPDEEAAREWLDGLRTDPEAIAAEVDDALRIANRALHAHRSATLDPYLADVSAEHALSVRVGYGSGDGLADGRWREAVEVPSSERSRRAEALRPQERVAAVLAGRESVAACEALLVRARADLDQGRLREAALQLRAGLEALLIELGRPGGRKQRSDIATLEERNPITRDAAGEALRGELGPGRAIEIAETLAVCERVLRRQRIEG